VVSALHGSASMRTQVPLILACSAATHAYQGWTFPETAVNLCRTFTAGQAQSGLYLTPIRGGLHLVCFDELKKAVETYAIALKAVDSSSFTDLSRSDGL